MFIGGAILKDRPSLVMVSDAMIDRVVTFKLLGVNVASDLKWNTHQDKLNLACIFKAAQTSRSRTE